MMLGVSFFFQLCCYMKALSSNVKYIHSTTLRKFKKKKKQKYSCSSFLLHTLSFLSSKILITTLRHRDLHKALVFLSLNFDGIFFFVCTTQLVSYQVKRVKPTHLLCTAFKDVYADTSACTEIHRRNQKKKKRNTPGATLKTTRISSSLI